MRYIIVAFKGEPTQGKPVGMRDIVGIGLYATAALALRYMFPDPHWRRAALRSQGYTQIGVYSFPPNYSADCELKLAATI